MKYSINDYIKKNDTFIKIIDFEIIEGFCIYYFSDGTSLEESQFKIVNQKESMETAAQNLLNYFK